MQVDDEEVEEVEEEESICKDLEWRRSFESNNFGVVIYINEKLLATTLEGIVHLSSP